MPPLYSRGARQTSCDARHWRLHRYLGHALCHGQTQLYRWYDYRMGKVELGLYWQRGKSHNDEGS